MIYWLEINVMIALAYSLFWLGKKFMRGNQRVDFTGNFIFVLPLFFLAPYLAELIPLEVPMPPVLTKAAKSMAGFSIPDGYNFVASNRESMASQNEPGFFFSLDSLLFLLFSLGFLIWLVDFFKGLFRLGKIIRESVEIKSLGSVKILAGESIRVPCSFWLVKSYVFVPFDLLSEGKKLDMAISHELQHHRQGDTKVLYFLELLRGLFFFNPAIHIWIKQINLLQEVRCDRKVMLRKHYSSKEYVRTLFQVARTNSGVVPQGTLAMASFDDLTRRIDMITEKSGSRGFFKRMTLLALSLTFVWQTACATKMNVGLTKLTLGDAEELVASIESDFPIEVNETVLKWLNYYLGDPKGKTYVQRTKANMVRYEAFIKEKLRAENFPSELLAVPFMESGYRNDSLSIMGARGLWQFIPGTARRFGLKVDGKVDERLDVGKSTQAAISYYSKLLSIKEFGRDWRLALLSYNTGEGALKKAISKRGTKDPWAFNDLGDQEYLAKIMAGIIILKSPRL